MVDTNKQPDINLSEMTDDEIANFDPSQLEGLETGEVTSDDQSAAEIEAGENYVEEPGGADSTEDSPDDDKGGADSTSTDVFADTDTEQQATEQQDQTTEAHQAEDQGENASEDTETQSENVDYEREYNRIMAPFRAAKREITPKTPDELRRLAQMGADYSRKMEAMKPYQRIVKTLDKNGLLDIEKVNFLIDLDQKNPEAIKKFLRDNEIDPIAMDLEEDTEYQPTDHMIGDQEMNLNTVLDDIRDTPTFSRTVKTITEDWDKASRKVLMDNPSVIADINGHIADGYFDQIVDQVANDRVFGRLEGLSDLEAYKKVGDAIHAAGGFYNQPNQPGTSTTGNTDQDFSQDSGSSVEADKLRNRKKAASPTKGSASAGKPKIDLSKMTDAQIEELDPATLM
jgi:hypothetical protein